MIHILVMSILACALTTLAVQATELKRESIDSNKSVVHEVSPQAAETVNPASTPMPNDTNSQWMERHVAKLKAIHEQPIDLLFIGDSITQDWELDGPEPWRQFKTIWDKYFGSLNAMNLGFDGDTTANVLWRLEHGEIEDIHPKVIVLEIGTNNTGRMHWSAEQTVDGIEAIVTLIHEKTPRTKVVLLGILPAGLCSATRNLQVNDGLLHKFENSEFVVYEDLSDLFLQHGVLDRELYLEGKTSPYLKAIHPSSEGQERMAKVLKPILLKLMYDQTDDLHRKDVEVQ
jgi:lysophospholipase L1-like esterase